MLDLITYVQEHSEASDRFEEARRQLRDQRVYSTPQPLLSKEELITLIILLCVFLPIAYLLGAQYLAAFPTIPQP